MEHRGCLGSETITPYDTAMMNSCYYAFVKSHKVYNANSQRKPCTLVNNNVSILA